MDLAENLITKLLALGVEEFCICAGARNSPLVEVFEKNVHLSAFHFFEERSAGFFALGRIAQTKKPVAVMTTSGTAVAELLPSVIEAFYTGAPLIVISADRPKKYRGTGAPQAIEQIGLFSNYIETYFDVDFFEPNCDFSKWTQKTAVQVNICFDEPLLDRPPVTLNAASQRSQIPNRELQNLLSEQNRLNEFLKASRPLVILSGLAVNEHEIVLNFLKTLRAPVYAETLSGLRGHKDIEAFEIVGGDLSAASFIQNKQCDAILRIGGVPTLRLWRDLEEVFKDVPVFNMSQNPFSGLARREKVFPIAEIQILKNFKNDKTFLENDFSLKRDQEASHYLSELVRQYPLSEQSWYNLISKSSENENIYLGNSLPVRQWDLVSERNRGDFSKVFGNRGANGIDGQLSTFFGWAENNKSNWCVLGDLTTMYDLSAPWILTQIENLNFNLVIMNNHGGQIFKRMFGDKKLFLNPHQVEFSHWAKMWNLEYQLYSAEKDQIHFQKTFHPKKTGKAVIEIHPDSVQTENFNIEWQRFWKNEI